jgi:hypothetical protein
VKLHPTIKTKNSKYKNSMEYKLPTFDQLYDGYFSHAVQIVKIRDLTKDFNNDVDDQSIDLYLSSHFAVFDSILTLIDNINKQDNNFVMNMRSILMDFKAKCKPSYFLFSYLQLLVIACKYNKDNIMYQAQDLFTDFLAIDVTDIKQSMVNFDVTYPNLIPFISPKGYFGINTFLYLFFHNLFPVGISINPISAHGTMYELPLDVSLHDVNHYFHYYKFFNQQPLKGHEDAYDHIVRAEVFSPDYVDKMYSFYQRTIHSDLCLDDKKFHILCLFFLIHELCEQLSTLTDERRKFGEDELRIAVQIPTYSPTSLGFSSNEETEIKNFIQLPDYIEYDRPDSVKRYINRLLTLFNDVMCKL